MHQRDTSMQYLHNRSYIKTNIPYGKLNNCTHELGKMLTAIIIVARVQPGTSKGITDLLLPQPSSGLRNVSGPSSFPPLQ